MIDRPHFKLKATIAPYGRGLYNLELKQQWPNAKHPHWRNVLQVCPTREELIALRNIIQEALHDQH